MPQGFSPSLTENALPESRKRILTQKTVVLQCAGPAGAGPRTIVA
jgi:hypothetical protein